MDAPLPWYNRSIGIPVMPGTLDEAVPNLRALLGLVEQTGGDLEAEVKWPGTQVTTLRSAVNRIGPCGLVRRPDRERIELTSASQAWLLDGTPETLIRALHNHVQFVGELLHEVDSSTGGLSQEELRSLAVEVYRMPWNTVDPVRKRTAWLRATGMIYLSFNNRVLLTERGAALLATLTIATADEVSGPGSTEPDPSRLITPPEGEIATALEALDEEGLRARHFGFGYMPRPVGSTVTGTIRDLVDVIGQNGERSHFIEQCVERFELIEQSAPRVLSMLTTVGLAVQTSATHYSLTPLAEAWNASRSDLDLVRIFHARIAVVGELLDAVEYHDRAPALSRYAVEQYAFRHDVDGVRVRLHLMAAAGLLQEYGLGRFRITPLGEAFRKDLPRLRAVSEIQRRKSPGTERTSQKVESTRDREASNEIIASELLAAGRDSENPDRLERAVRDAFRYLGFEAEQLGGSGKTDVLVSFSDSPGRTTIVSVDAKSAATGVVAEGSINFDTLGEHRKRHEATFSCIVGPTFHASRLPKWAKERDVALVETELLAAAVRRQSELALGTIEIAGIFDTSRDPAEVLNSAWQKAERRNQILTSVIAALSREAETADEVTRGTLSLDNLYFLLRNDLEVKPDPESIGQAVAFLASPFVASVSSTAKNVYVATEKPATIARKLRALALAAQKAADLLEA
jgi:hypothetical protein